MSRIVQEVGILRNHWDKWLRQYKDSIREVARRAGVSHVQLAKAINTGVASENMRDALARINVPDHLIPLPSCNRILAAMVYSQQELLKTCQNNVRP